MTGKILIADASATGRIRLKIRLAAACYETCHAGDVRATLEAARFAAPDVIIADESLPGGGLPALLAGLAAAPSGRVIPVIAICGAEKRLAAVRAGAAAVVERGAEEVELLARLRNLLIARTADGAEADPAFGMAEAQAPFAPPAPAARIVLVAADAPTAISWRAALAGVGLRSEIATPERALATAHSDDQAADLYMIAADLDAPDSGLRLLSELRARPASRHAAFVIALPEHRRTVAPIALDLGAGDVLPMDLRGRAAAEEAALRMNALLARKQIHDRRRLAAERERQWAMLDPLTGLHNRRYAQPRLGAMLAAHPALAVMVVDLDHFKAINDQHGHAGGDAVLVAVSGRLRSALGPDALLARLGGEEFIIAAPVQGLAGAEALAERLRHAVSADPVALDPAAGGLAVRVTASIGLAIGGRHHADRDPLLTADRALLRAKTTGRNRVILAAQDAAA